MNEEISNPWPDQPPENSANNDEIAEEDLEQISGGITPIPIPEIKIGKFAGDLTQVNLNPGNLGNLSNEINRTGKV